MNKGNDMLAKQFAKERLALEQNMTVEEYDAAIALDNLMNLKRKSDAAERNALIARKKETCDAILKSIHKNAGHNRAADG